MSLILKITRTLLARLQCEVILESITSGSNAEWKRQQRVPNVPRYTSGLHFNMLLRDSVLQTKSKSHAQHLSSICGFRPHLSLGNEL